METVFKIGDKVYCVVNGHGIVKKVMSDNNYPVYVKFENDSSNQYTFDGRLYNEGLPTLSFTEYTLEGFSQERPCELPEVGDWCLVRDYDTDEWKCREFYGFSNGKYYTKDYRGIACYWKKMKRIKILD